MPLCRGLSFASFTFLLSRLLWFLSPQLHTIGRACGLYDAADELPQRGHISTVITRLVNRRLQNKRAPCEQRVIQNSAKRFRADFAFADMLVAIHARTERGFRIVYVQHEDAVESHRAVDQPQGRFEAFGGANIVTRGKDVSGVNADTDIQISAAFEDRFHLFELPAERRAFRPASR